MPKNQPTPSTSTPKKSAKREPVFEHGARRFDAIYDTDTEDLAHMKQQKMPRMSFATQVQRNEAPAPNVPSTSSTSAAPNNGFKAPLPPSSQKGSSPVNNVGGSAPGPSNDGNSTRKRHLNTELSTSKSNGSPSTRQTRRSNGAPLLNVPSTSTSSAATNYGHAQDCQPGPSPYSNPSRNNGMNGDCAPGSSRNGKRLSQEPANFSSTSKRSRTSKNASSSPQPSSSNAANKTRNGTHSPSVPSTSASKSDALAEDNERHGAAKIPEYRERIARKSGSASRTSPIETDGAAAATSDPDSGISSGSSRESTGPTTFKVPLMRPPRKTMTISREPSVAPSICSREGSVFSVASSSWNQEPQTNRTVWLSLLDELQRDPSDAEKARIVSEVEKMRRTFTESEKEEFDDASRFFEYQEHRRANSVSIMAPIRSRQSSVAPDDDEGPFRGQPWRGAREESSRRSLPVVEEEEDEEEQTGGDMDDVGGQMDDEEPTQQNQDGRDGNKEEPKKRRFIAPQKLVKKTSEGEKKLTWAELNRNFVNNYRHNKKLFHTGTDRRHCDLSLEEKDPQTMNFGEEKNKEFVERHATKPDGPETQVYKSNLKVDAVREVISIINGEKIIEEVDIITAKQIPKAKECSPENHYGNLRDKKMWTTPVVSKMKESLKKVNKSLMRKLRKRMEKELAEEGEEPTEAKIIEKQFFEILKVAYIRPIWQQFRGHIPMEFALQNLMGNGYDFGKSLDNIDRYLNILPQQPPNLCSSQAKGMHEWLYYCVAFKGDKKGERTPDILNTRSLLHLESTRNFFPFEMHNMCFQFHRYYQYQNRFGVPCNCKEWLCESIPFEPRYACRNCTKNGKVDHDYMKKLCLICQAYKKWFKKDRPAKEVNFTSDEKKLMKDWITMDTKKNEKMTREEFEKEHKKALDQKWRNGIMEAEEELMLNIDEVSTMKKFKTEEERNEFICKELQPFEMPHFTKCNCIASGRFPNGSRGVIFKEKDRKEFANALRETNSVKEAARLMGWSMDDAWLFLHRFGREKPMWKSFKAEELDRIFRGMNRLSTHLPPNLPVPIRNQRVWPCKEVFFCEFNLLHSKLFFFLSPAISYSFISLVLQVFSSLICSLFNCLLVSFSSNASQVPPFVFSSCPAVRRSLRSIFYQCPSSIYSNALVRSPSSSSILHNPPFSSASIPRSSSLLPLLLAGLFAPSSFSGLLQISKVAPILLRSSLCCLLVSSLSLSLTSGKALLQTGQVSPFLTRYLICCLLVQSLRRLPPSQVGAVLTGFFRSVTLKVCLFQISQAPPFVFLSCSVVHLSLRSIFSQWSSSNVSFDTFSAGSSVRLLPKCLLVLLFSEFLLVLVLHDPLHSVLPVPFFSEFSVNPMPTPPPENQPQRSIMYPEEDLDFDIYRNPKCLACLAAFLIGALLCTFGVAAIYCIPREYFPEWFKEYMGADWVNFGKH